MPENVSFVASYCFIFPTAQRHVNIQHSKIKLTLWAETILDGHHAIAGKPDQSAHWNEFISKLTNKIPGGIQDTSHWEQTKEEKETVAAIERGVDIHTLKKDETLVIFLMRVLEQQVFKSNNCHVSKGSTNFEVFFLIQPGHWLTTAQS